MDLPQSPQDPSFGDIFSEVPLFREIQRVLLSSSGPVNWELARQIGIAAAAWGQEDQPPSDADQRGFEETVRLAEIRVAEFTGLEPPTDVAPVQAVRRSQWVQANIEGLKALVEPAAAKLAGAVSRLQQEQAPAGAADVAQQML